VKGISDFRCRISAEFCALSDRPPHHRNPKSEILLRERADTLQGTLEWRRPPQGGTLVILEVPL